MKRLVLSSCIIALFVTLTVTGAAPAQDKFPSKPISVVVPFSAGGSTDLLARAVEKIWPKYSSQPLVVVNKPGGGGVVGTEFVVRSKPDGYTLFLGSGSGHDVVMTHLQKMPYAGRRGDRSSRARLRPRRAPAARAAGALARPPALKRHPQGSSWPS